MKPITTIAAIFTGFFLVSPPGNEIGFPKTNPGSKPKIQAAILLDVSNSMDGLIDQAKAQLWNMVNTMAKAECNNQSPEIQIALYEYGRPTNDKKEGYVKKINEFISDLDQLSQNLFSLKTNGGDEYCGHVMYSSLSELKWDSSSSCYKVIFIAGNEDFLQGDISYTKACEEAKKKNVIINTIYCGPRMQGINEHWNLGAECGVGSFTNINQNAKDLDIPTPYDTSLITLNSKLNSTYVYYGADGVMRMQSQEQVDKLNSSLSREAGVKRVAAKGKTQLYKNSTWDLVDANADGVRDRFDTTFIAKVDRKTLPDSLKFKSNQEILAVINAKADERGAIQKEIQSVYAKREVYINEEKKKRATTNNEPTLESEIEKIIREQVKQFNMIIR